jgi:membrane associated rhomboid family serine protease
MASLLHNLKSEINKPDNALVKLILLNASVFVVLLLLKIILTLSNHLPTYQWVVDLVRVPSALPELAQRPWTVFTYFFAHEEIFHILFNMLFLYWFGKLIDEYLGTKRLVALYILGGLAGAITYVLIYNVSPYFREVVGISRMLGASASVYAVTVGAATLLPNYTFSLLLLGPVRIKYIALFYILLSLAQSVGPNAGGNLAHLGGAIVGYVFIKMLQSGNDLGKPLYLIGELWSRLFRKKSTMKVTFKAKAVQRNPTSPRPASSSRTIEVPDQDEVDSILDKISQSGYESLSKEEKQKLFRASQRK